MSNVQCAHCNNKPACNIDTFFESQLFCWEKDLKEWAATKGKRVCKKGLCFVGTNKREMGKLEGICQLSLSLDRMGAGQCNSVSLEVPVPVVP